MKHTAAPSTLENTVLKKADESDVLDIAYEGRNSVIAIPVWYSPLDKKYNQLLKRVFDVAASTVLLVLVFSWLLPLIALLIKMDSRGPVFFIQKRNNKGGGRFSCIKFRTMVVNEQADHLPAFEDDHRITGIGRFLRNHHLDELPQLLNVWVGNMSIVGPRPHMISDNEKYQIEIEHYSYRHSVKPGITGLAQVLGYVGPILTIDNMKERFEKDIHYIRNWSFKTDLYIVYRTLFKMAGKK